MKFGPNTITDGLILALDAANPRSYPGSGTAWKDIVSNNDGTLTNGPTFSNDKGGSIVLDGVNDYVNLSFANPLSETISVWASSTTSTWNINGWISSARRQNGHIIHPTPSTKDISYYVLNSAVSYTLIGSFTLDDITIPHMYTMTTNGSNLHKGYVDGVLVTTSTTSITRTPSPTNQPWTLGRDDGLSRYGNGSVYNCLRYNKALSLEEIQQNYNATKNRFK